MFGAWEVILTASIASTPTIIVVEDLHWATAALLDFLNHLAASKVPIPLLILATARPELLDKQSWEGSRSEILQLDPLSDVETNELVTSLMGSLFRSDATVAAVVQRADGNPLFAEEYVKSLVDRLMPGTSPSALEPLVPDSLNSLLAARLDTLTHDLKSVVQDAAVMGRAFQPAALMVVGTRTHTQVRDAMAVLRRRGLVLPAHSGAEDDGTAQFWHALLRDVAYAQIPRPSRAAKHLAVADWIATRSSGKLAEVANTLAYHLGTAWDLAGELGDRELGDSIRPQALQAMTVAADQAVVLDVHSAVRRYGQALALARPSDPGYPRLLHQTARALRAAGRLGEAVDVLQQVLELHRRSNDVPRQASVLGTLGYIQYRRGEVADPRYAEEAVELLRTGPPNEQLVQALIGLAESYCLQADYERALTVLDEASTLHGSLSADERERRTVDNWLLFDRAEAEFQMGNAVRLADMESAHTWDETNRTPWRIRLVRWHRLAVCQYQAHGPMLALDTLRQAMARAEHQGVEEVSGWNAVLRHLYLLEIGPPEPVVEGLRLALPTMQANGEQVTVDWANSVVALALTELGRPQEAAELARLSLDRARRTQDPELLVAASTAIAAAEVAERRFEPTLSALDELAGVVESSGLADAPFYPAMLPRLMRAALQSDGVDLAERLASAVRADLPLRENVATTCQALLAEHTDHTHDATAFIKAALLWQRFGNTYERAHALFGAALAQQASGDRAYEGTASRAKELFIQLKAGRRIADCNEILTLS